MGNLFTVGYTAYPQELFIEALKHHHIDVVADVRSAPFSAYYKDFNQDVLQAQLKQQGFLYVFLGKELGARPEDRSVYVDGRVDFDLVRRAPFFVQGLQRLRTGLQQYNVALLCAEKDPIQCHRSILICKELCAEHTVQHIFEKKYVDMPAFVLESHASLETRLLTIHFKNQYSLFYSEKQMLTEAYKKQGTHISYQEEDENYEYGE